ncbi:SWI/SNF-related matrix-associated actin-dependent regulator of chromatin subfamily A-like protein 1 isoform X2 [Cucurbita pepo subsp. pepo]|uniref:SWI/SNF-related matrix-associated actin-dependent regulator of chromatin subfamily A-like protein 1 isoform X2 n=1 Tax=Cucurbita pepo subsp. pepo TaxID=3664 RepID=UPI000C9D4DCC|nr:SWI/SNF-related matrix-associated actin-dependent regulator of chromatin subfamily A-like protein 1 isoform X2 [Cucurbita pepo subsp. pepo]
MEFGDEDDDWNLTLEELDSLERDAVQKIAQLHSAAASASSSSVNVSIPCSAYNQYSHQFVQSNEAKICNLKPQNPAFQSPQLNPARGSHSRGVETLPPLAGVLPSSATSKEHIDEGAKELPKLSVKFFLHSSGNIAAKFSYDQVLVEAFRKIPKATWNAKERLWMFPISSMSAAENVLRDVVGSKVEVEKLDSLVHRAIIAASLLPDLRDKYNRLPADIESKLLPFQREGVGFILQHGGRALLADEMGLGKTLQAIAVAACIRESWPVLILAPSSLRLHWAAMIQQWLKIPSSDIHVVLSQNCGSNKSGFTILSSSTKSTIHLDGLFNIISYDAVQKLQNILMASEFKVVIADESHYMKNAQAKRTVACLPIIQKAQYAILLSGTPALSRPIELLKQLEALYPNVYKSVHEYGNRYCKGGTFGLYQGASNHEELHNLMKATLMIRRLKKEVLSELPLKRRQQVFLDLAEKDIRGIKALFCELEVIKGKIKACRSEEEVESLKFQQKNLINKIYTDSAEAKIPAVLNYLETVVEGGCKFLVFAHHQPMIVAIHQFFQKKKVNCIRIDGGTPSATRQALVADFQQKDSIRAAVLSIRAAGVGLTLTAASTVIFAELSWTPGDLIQAEDRAHRIGQVSSVNIHYLLANDTVDDIIWDVVQSKLENLGQMLDGEENTLEVAVKQQPTSSSSPNSKQKTLDSFIKRCNNVSADTQSKLKLPRH